MPTVTTYPGVFGPYSPITFTRASTATYFDSTGTLTTAETNAPRLDYDPSTLAALGLLIEEARTNSIRNNTMVGAVAGTPGTLPTNWFTVIGAGLSQQVVGTGTENGINYVDFRIFGTTAGSVTFDLGFEPNTQVAALTGQIWTESLYQKLVGGTLTNIASLIFRFNEFTSAGVFVSGQSSPSLSNPTASNLATQRVNATITLNGGATTAFLQAFLRVTTGTGAVDITLRIGLPQLELGAFVTSVIPTTTTALTRAADVASVNTLSPWFNSASGTLYVEATTPPGLAGFPNSIGISDGTINNRTLTYVFTNGFYSGITTGGVSQGNAAVFVTPTIGAASKFAAAYNTNLLQSALNGTAGTPDTTINLPSGLNIMRIGAATLSSNFYNSHIQRITYYPRAFSQTELQTLTT